MTGRTRSRSFTQQSGYYTLKRYNPATCTLNGLDGTVDIVRSAGVQSCNDHISPRPYYDGTLDLYLGRLHGPTISGYYGDNIICNPSFSGPVAAYKCSQLWNPVNVPSFPFPQWSYYTTKGMASLNPNMPSVDIFEFLFEFKDFPGMLRDLGRVLAKKLRPSDVPGGYLAYQFGWAPLFSDLKSLLDLTKLIDRKKKLLLAAEEKDGVAVTHQLGGNNTTLDFGGTSAPFDTFTGTGILLYTGTWQLKMREKYWISARLKLLTQIPSDEIDRTAEDLVLGLSNVSAATLWEMLPWSWLIDYFANVGDMLNASRGNIQWTATRANLMCKQQIFGELMTTFVAPGLVVSNGSLEFTQKSRIQPLLRPTIALAPFLSRGERGILTNLVTARALKSIRL